MIGGRGPAERPLEKSTVSLSYELDDIRISIMTSDPSGSAHPMSQRPASRDMFLSTWEFLKWNHHPTFEFSSNNISISINRF